MSTLTSGKRRQRKNVFEFPSLDNAPTVNHAFQQSGRVSRQTLSRSCSIEGIETLQAPNDEGTNQITSDLTLCVINVESASSLEPSLSSDTLSSRGASPSTEGRSNKFGVSPPNESPYHDEKRRSFQGGFMMSEDQTRSYDEGLSRLKSSSSYSKQKAATKRASFKCCPFGTKRQDMNKNIQPCSPEQDFKPRCPFRLGSEEDGLNDYADTTQLYGPQGLYDHAQYSSSEVLDTRMTCAIPTVVVRPPPESHRTFSRWRCMLRRSGRKGNKDGRFDASFAGGSRAESVMASLPTGCPMRRMFSQVLTRNYNVVDDAGPSPGKRSQSCYSFRNLEDAEPSAGATQKESSGRFHLPKFNLHFPKLKSHITKDSILTGHFFSSPR